MHSPSTRFFFFFFFFLGELRGAGLLSSAGAAATTLAVVASFGGAAALIISVGPSDDLAADASALPDCSLLGFGVGAGVRAVGLLEADLRCCFLDVLARGNGAAVAELD